MNNKSIRDQIDDYKDSIFAIIGFANLFRYDDSRKRMRDDLLLCQGRRLRTSLSNRLSPDNEVTPDLCLCDSRRKGIIGEVKRSFPLDQDQWIDDFNQLMRYDDELKQWMTDDGTVDDHEIVLLPEQSRSRAIIRYYENEKGNAISFTKNFVIVQFNRSDQAKSFFFFRKEYGDFVNYPEINSRLEDGVKVPLEKLMLHYEKIKLYDAQPPPIYLMQLIWENIVMFRASMNEKFRSSRRIDVELSIDEIVNELRDNYTFNSVNANNHSYQPDIPHRSWIIESVDLFVRFGLAKWNDAAKTGCVIYFKKFKNILEDFIKLYEEKCLKGHKETQQMELFNCDEEKVHTTDPS
ncbi:MAG: hypothetical protein AB2L22_12015 [Syntrophales bacterium]